jgi:signal transduction histidine kinase
MTAIRTSSERPRQDRVIWALLLMLILILGGVNIWRKATLAVPRDALSIRDTAAGLAVAAVATGSPAQKADIRAGDVITAVNGLTVGNAVAYRRTLNESAGTGQRVVYSLLREGRAFNRLVDVPRRPDGDLLYAVLALSGLAAALLGGLVGLFGRHPGERGLLTAACYAFALATLLSPVGAWDRFDLVVNGLDDTGTLLLPVLFLAFCIRFPASVSPAPARSRWPGRLTLAAAVTATTGLFLLFAVWYGGLLVAPGNPYTTTTMYGLLRRLVLGWLGISFLAGGLITAVRTARTGQPVLRQQLLWMSLGTLLGGTPPLLLYFMPNLAGIHPAEWQTLSLATLALIPAAFGTAVLRYRLADAPLVFKRSIVYAVSTAATLLAVLLALGATARWLPVLADPRRPAGMFFWAATAVAVSAIFFPRIRDSLARSADRLHFGRDFDRRQRLAAFDPFRLDPSLPPDRLVELFMEEVSLALSVSPVRYFTPDETLPDEATESGGPAPGRRCRVARLGDPWHGCYQLLVMESAGSGQGLGAVGLGPRSRGGLLSSQDLDALLPAAELLAMALENSILTRRLMEQQRLASLGQLAAGVAHEINTPLTGISSYTEMLLEEDAPSGGENGERAELVKKIGTQARRAERIVSSLLQFARQKGGDMQLLDLNRVTGQAVALFDHRLRASAIEFRLEQSPDPLPVNGDATRLQQVLFNLMNNALGAMPEGGRLTVRTAADGESALVSVADTGPGIPADVRPRIFEPFFTTRPPGSGTGLGLSICHGIIRDHRGQIGVDNNPGGGTVFTVTLPAIEQP